MAIFFTKKTVDEVVEHELPEAQKILLHKLKGNQQVMIMWEQHAEKCEAAQTNGIVVIQNASQEQKKTEHGNIYGKTDLTITCSCKQVIYTIDEKGNLKEAKNVIDGEKNTYLVKDNTYLTKRESSLYSQK